MCQCCFLVPYTTSVSLLLTISTLSIFLYEYVQDVGIYGFFQCCFGASSLFGLLILLAGLSLAPSMSIPFGFRRLPHFIFYVYAGYYLWLKKDLVLRWFRSKSSIVLLVLVYIAFVIAEHSFIVDTGGLWNYLFRHTLMLIKSCVAIIALYTIIYRFTHMENFRPSRIVIEANNLCYGLYVFHQFILVYLYQYTNFYSVFGDTFTPWVAFLVIISLSILMANLALKTKLGRLLIG